MEERWWAGLAKAFNSLWSETDNCLVTFLLPVEAFVANCWLGTVEALLISVLDFFLQR